MHFCAIVYSPVLQYANACYRLPHATHATCHTRRLPIEFSCTRTFSACVVCLNLRTRIHKCQCNFRDDVANIKTHCSLSKCKWEDVCVFCFSCWRLRAEQHINSLGKCCYAYASFDWLTASLMCDGMSSCVCSLLLIKRVYMKKLNVNCYTVYNMC